MANWYYYNENGEKIGPIRGRELKQLALQGTITPETLIENDEWGSLLAGQTENLRFPETPPPRRLPESNPFTASMPVAENPFTAPMPGGDQEMPQIVPVPDASRNWGPLLVAIVGIVVILAVGGTILYKIMNEPPKKPIPIQPVPLPGPPNPRPDPPVTPVKPDPVPIAPVQPVAPIVGDDKMLIAPNDDRVYYFNSTCMTPPSTGLFESLVTTYIDSGGTARRSHGGPEIMKNVRSVHAINRDRGTSFFITTNNELWAMGRNVDGYVGDDTGLDRDSPVLVMKDVANLYFADGVVYAIKTDKSRWGWGPGVKNGQTAYAPVKLDNNYNANEELSARHIITVNERYDTIKIDGEFRSDLPMDLSDRATVSLLASAGLDAGNIVAVRSTTRSQYISPSLMGARKTPARYYALDKAGVLWGWGHNDGILGDGTKANRDRAVKIAENVTRIMPRFFVTQSGDWFFYSNVAFNENATLQNKNFAPYVPRIAFENCLYTFACYGDKGIFAYNFPDNVWYTPDGRLVYSTDGSGVYESGGFKVHEIVNDIKLPSIVRASDGQVIAPKPGQLKPRAPRPPVEAPPGGQPEVPLITFVKGANFLKGLPPMLEMPPAKMQSLTLGEAFDSVPGFEGQRWGVDGNTVTLTLTDRRNGGQTNMKMSFVPNTTPGAATRISGATFYANGAQLNNERMAQFLVGMYNELK